MSVFVLDYFQRVCKVFEDNAFFFSLFDLDHVSRHFILSSSVNVVDFLCSESYGSSACVHGSVSAADDRYFLSKLDFFVSHHFSEEVDTADDSCSILALASDTCRDPCSYAEQHCVKVFFNCFERDILADPGICHYFHTHSLDGENLLVKHSLWQSVLRDTVSQHTACLRHRFEYRHLVTHLSEEVRCRQTHRAAAYDRYSLACIRAALRDEHVCVCKILISDETLEPLYRNRLVYETSPALVFTRMRAYSSQ